MNIFIPLLAGVLVGYTVRRGGRRLDPDRPMALTLLLLIFLMGVDVGKININASWMLVSSVVFATLTMAGSVAMALIVGGKK